MSAVMVEKGVEEKSKSQQQRKELAIKQNVQVLSRYFSGIRGILFYAHNVCVYDFDEVNKCWKRSEIEGAFHIVDTSTDIRYRIIVLNRRGLENLALDMIPGWTQFEEVKGTIQLQSPQGKIYALWFFDEEEKVEAVKVLSSLLNQQGTMQENSSTVQKSYGVLSEKQDDFCRQQTPEKEILRLLKAPERNTEIAGNAVESSPSLQKRHEMFSPGRIGSPFPSASIGTKTVSTFNYTTFSETAGKTPPGADAGKQILALLKHVESTNLNDPSETSSRNSSFNFGYPSRELLQSSAMKEPSFPQLQAAAQVLANNSTSPKDSSKGLQTGEMSKLTELFKRPNWKNTFPSSDDLKELLTTIMQEDSLFQQFYSQYIEALKSLYTKPTYSFTP